MYVTRLHFYHRNQHDTERKHMTKWTFCIIRNTEKQTEKITLVRCLIKFILGTIYDFYIISATRHTYFYTLELLNNKFDRKNSWNVICLIIPL